MLMTCRSLFAISCMMSAMRSAISPDTPVSISSKTMVGSFTAPAIMAFTESMTRAISPPDATDEMFCRVPFLLAENRNVTVSMPWRPGSFRSPMSTTKRTLGMPSGTRRAAIWRSTSRAASRRASVRPAACRRTSLCSSPQRFFSVSISSSDEEMEARRVA